MFIWVKGMWVYFSFFLTSQIIFNVPDFCLYVFRAGDHQIIQVLCTELYTPPPHYFTHTHTQKVTPTLKKKKKT